MAYLLGIDIGTTGTRALVCDHAGQVVGVATAQHEVYSPQPGHSEQDPRHWWQATCTACRKVMGQARIKRDQVTSVGLSGQMHGSVFLDSAGQPLRRAILWNDQRTVAQCQQIQQAAGSRRKLIDLVGNPALTGFTAPKMLWVREHEPAVYEKTRQVLLPKDYVRYCMTGEYATDVGDASGTLLLDVKNRRWSDRLISLLQIDPAVLPPVHEAHQVVGELNASAAKALGLSPGTPVVAGSGDQPAGAVGNGIVRSGIAGATLGTSGVVFVHADQPVYDPLGRVHTMCSAVAGKWCVFGCMLSAGGSLQWFRNHMALRELLQAKREKLDPYELLIQQAATAEPGSQGLYFLPYLTGERCPHPDPHARGGWIGLTSRHNRSSMIRSVLEGVTFGMADALQIIDQMDIPVRKVRLSGGGARSEFWRQLQADIYARPVATINANEGPAYGAAILAGVGAGVWRNVPQACRAVIHETTTHKPHRQRAACYARWHKQYQQLYHVLKDTFAHWQEGCDT